MRFIPDGSDEKVPMDPEDYGALPAWVKAKERRGDTLLNHKTFPHRS